MSLLLPREHGAYGQLACALVASFAIGAATTTALLTGAGAVAAFLAATIILAVGPAMLALVPAL